MVSVQFLLRSVFVAWMAWSSCQVELGIFFTQYRPTSCVVADPFDIYLNSSKSDLPRTSTYESISCLVWPLACNPEGKLKLATGVALCNASLAQVWQFGSEVWRLAYVQRNAYNESQTLCAPRLGAGGLIQEDGDGVLSSEIRDARGFCDHVGYHHVNSNGSSL